MRDLLLNDLKKQQKVYREKVGGDITRNYYAENGKYSQAEYSAVFGNFVNFKEEILKDDLNRKNFDVKRKASKGRKTYFVTSVIASAELDIKFFLSVQTYLKKNDAELVILPMRGVRSTDWSYHESVLQLKEYFSTSFSFNTNLSAYDFLLTPQQINPLTGLNRFGHKKTSLIIASPKQQLSIVPTSYSGSPHIVHSTGSITKPKYARTRQGRLAHQDHIVGGLIVEVEDKKIFHIRQIQGDKKGGFYDIDRYYQGKTVKKSTAKAVVLGDLHIGSEDTQAITAWKELIKAVKPETVMMHDILDCRSINHHERKKITYNATANFTLKQELDLVSKTLDNWCSSYKKTNFVIVKSNHDSWLDDYLANGWYCDPDQHHNHKFALELAVIAMNEQNPLETYVRKSNKFNYNNLTFLEIDSDYKINGVELGAHGSKGNNGARGSIRGIEIAYGNSITGHSHTPAILRDSWTVGTSTKLNLGYNKGGGSSWLHTSCILHQNGKKQLINSINGKWRLER